MTTGQRNVIRFAADLLEEYARLLVEGHCLPDGTWPADCAVAQKDHLKHLWCAQQLRGLVKPKRRKKQKAAR